MLSGASHYLQFTTFVTKQFVQRGAHVGSKPFRSVEPARGGDQAARSLRCSAFRAMCAQLCRSQGYGNKFIPEAGWRFCFRIGESDSHRNHTEIFAGVFSFCCLLILDSCRRRWASSGSMAWIIGSLFQPAVRGKSYLKSHRISAYIVTVVYKKDFFWNTRPSLRLFQCTLVWYALSIMNRIIIRNCKFRKGYTIASLYDFIPLGMCVEIQCTTSWKWFH